MSTTRTHRRSRALFLAITPLAIAASARASATFSGSSTVLITHNADDVNGHGGSGTKHVNPPPASSGMPVSPSYQYGGTLNYQNASSTADASIGAVTTSTITGFTLAPGTGVQQTDPSSVLHSSELVIAINGSWNISGSQGPTATGYLSFTLAGTVGSGGSAAYSVNLNFTNQSNVALRPAINTGGSFNPGSFSLPYTSNVAFSPTSLPNGSQVNVSGTITLTADADDPTTIAMSDFEVSDAPPTSRFVGASAGTADFNNASNWSSTYVDSSTSKLQTVPNGTGLRAVIVGPQASTNLQLTQPTTLGTLDIDQPGVSVTAPSENPLTFDTFGDNACLLIRNVQGESAHNVMGNIVLNKTLEVENDGSSTNLSLAGAAGQITGSGGLTLDGPGTVAMTGPASYTGTTTVSGGTLTVDQSNGNNGSITGSPSVNILAGGTFHLISVSAGPENLVSQNTVIYINSGSGGGANAQIILDLNGGIQEVASLFIDGVAQPAGIYQASKTGDGIYFSGNGELETLGMPEPASLSVLALPAILLLRRRRQMHICYRPNDTPPR
jgi:autotransporter-associated beta strand protein